MGVAPSHSFRIFVLSIAAPIAAGAACTNGAVDSAVTKERSAVTAAAVPSSPTVNVSPPSANGRRLREARMPSNWTQPAVPSRAMDLSANQHPGHFGNKVVDKPAAPTSVARPAPVPAAYIAKQNEYIQKWTDLQPTLASLPADEQARRRAALKRQVLGE
jgi:hypothetical protein